MTRSKRVPRIRLRPATLSKRGWERWWDDAGIRGKVKHEGVEAYGYWWSNGHPKSKLGLPTDPVRYCVACGGDAARGQTMVGPVTYDWEHGDWSATHLPHHVACVTPAQWDEWRRSAKRRYGATPTHKRSRPRRTRASLQRAIDEGWLELKHGLSIADALNTLRGEEKE